MMLESSQRASASAIIVAGDSATGKSTFAHRLAQEVHATLLDLDTITTALLEFAGGERLVWEKPSAEGRAAINVARYRCLVDAARENLGLGNDTILVAPFTEERASPERWEILRDELDVNASTSYMLWMDTPNSEATKRAAARGAPRDAIRLQQAPQRARLDADHRPSVGHIRIDGLKTPNEQVHALITHRQIPSLAPRERSSKRSS